MVMAMVSNHTQYLCPDYMNPNNNSSANVEKSPLALLAQTCNSIGLPDAPAKSKTILPASDKSSSPVKKEEKTAKSDSDTDSKPKKEHSKSDTRSNSASGTVTDENANKTKDNPTTNENSEDRPTSAPDRAAPANLARSAAPVLPPSSVGARCFPTLPPGYPLGAYPHLQMGASPFSHGLMASLGSGYPSLPLMGSGFGPGSIPRLCTDPMCKSCPPAHPGRSCPLGCTQCSSQQPDLSAMLLANSYSSLLHGFPGAAFQPSVSVAFNPVTSGPIVSSGSLPSLLGTTGSGSNVCNWVCGDGQLCLKRFATPEELMTHMRTHATQDQGKAPAVNPLLAFSSAGFPTSGRASPRTAYLNALRFHPYAKLGSPGVTSAPLAPHLPFPSPMNMTPAGYNTAAALSAIYGQRLPGSLPHP